MKKPGEWVMISAGTHMYPNGWVRGQAPFNIREPVLAVILAQEPEADVANPRLFLRILCPHGIGLINSAWCEAVG